MRNRRSLLAVALLAGTAAPALAQQNLYLVRSIDLSPIHQNRYTSADNLTNGSFFYIGNNPCAMDFDGTNIYVGGYINGAIADQGNAVGWNDSTPVPRAARPGSPNVLDTFGLTTNPLNDQPLVAGDFLTNMVDSGGFPSGRYWASGFVKITLNNDGTVSYVSNKFMKDTFSDAAWGTGDITNFLNSPGILNTPPNGTRNVSGIDLDRATGRLLVSFDGRGNHAGKIRVYDVSTQINPILVAPTPNNAFFSLTNAGIAGAAWDRGPTGAGLSYSVFPFPGAGTAPASAGVSPYSEASPLTGTGPVIAYLPVFAGGAAQFGPVGLAPGLLDYTANNGILVNNGSGSPSATTAPQFVYTAGDNNVGFNPQNNGPRITDSGANTVYRDIDIHSANGTVVARANNDLIVAYRSTDGTVAAGQKFRIPGTASVSSVCQNVRILEGFPGGDLVAWNDRGGSSPGNLGAVRFNRLDPANPTVQPPAVAVNWLNPDGTPFTVTAATKVWDFGYDAASGRFAMVDFDTRRVYIFTTTPPGPSACNIADIVGIGGNPPADGLLTGDDFNSYIAAFAANTSLADVVGIGGQPPADGLITGDDFNAFIAAFAAGCP